MQAALYGKARVFAVIFKEALRAQAVDDLSIAVVGRMVIHGRRRDSACQTQPENHRITKPFLRGEYRSLLDRQAVVSQHPLIFRQIGDVAKAHVIDERLSAGSKSKVFALGPVQEVMTAFETGLRIIRDLI